MRWDRIYLILFILILGVALLFRLPELSKRPMHGDEAVNAVKFGSLLESGIYTYNPQEYHGPSLYYFSLISAWIHSVNNYKDLDEATLRILPVIFSLILILLFFPLRNSIPWPLLLLSALFLAVSSAMVFYGRYYIHEMIFVCFNFGTVISGYLYLQKKSIKAAIVFSICLGMTIATKETWILHFIALTAALLLVTQLRQKIKSVRIGQLILLILICIFIILLFYSSFFKNTGAVKNIFPAYTSYLERGTQNIVHNHPFYYYLKLLIYFKYSDFPLWTEISLIILAIYAIFLIFLRKIRSQPGGIFFEYIAVYSLVLIGVFSIIPYKTPWNLLGFLPGLSILAGLGIMEISYRLNNKRFRQFFFTIIYLLFSHLLWQTYKLNFTYYAHPCNPYVYAHPTEDIFKIRDKMDFIALNHPQGYNLHVQVIALNDDYWPLPWYLKSFNRVGWWNHVDMDVPSAPIILNNIDVESDLIHKLYEVPPPGKRELYLNLFEDFIIFRPGIEFRGYIRKEIWDQLHNQNGI